MFYCRNSETLIPDAPELIANFLEGEQDASCKRNAFMMLIHADQDRALGYLSSCIDQVHSFNDILQLVIVELIYKVRLEFFWKYSSYRFEMATNLKWPLL
jgi:coatomer subunit beta